MVAQVVQELSARRAKLTAEAKGEAARLYREYVETHTRPEAGRRRAIALALGAPIKEVVLAVREWARRQEADSPNPRLSRTHLFQIEKAYFRELAAARYSLDEFPQRIADELGFANRWQVLRWIDVLHDDPSSFDAVPDPPDHARQAVIAAYEAYLAAEAPPEAGLHATIAAKVGDLKARQVHKVLQEYRHQRRAAYRPH
jgi:hypothetical protein